MRVTSISTTMLAALALAGAAAPVASAACDPIDRSHCLYPWPSNAYTKKDKTTDTGLRLALKAKQMPANTAGVHMAPGEYNRNDGFSPGSAIVIRVPGLDTPEAFRKTGAVPITDMGQSFDEDQPIVLINTRTDERTLIWSEIDANPANRRDVTLIIRPGRNLEEGTRYVVALRNLENAKGRTIRADRAFRKQRNAKKPGARFRRIFRDLKQADIARDDLYAAWDFTVASERNLSERALSIRDAAFAELGDRNLADLKPDGRSPEFAITEVTDYTVEQDPNIARQVRGTITVPCFLDQVGCPPGSGFRYASPTDTIPQRIPGNTVAAEFVCNIPRVALARPVRPGIYGHGLLGSPNEINQIQLKHLSQDHGFVFCGTPWKGMASEDVPHIATLLSEMSRFPTVPDRMQQGILDALFLGRAMVRPDGLSSHPAFQNGAGQPVLDTAPGRLYYDGNSQGGIMGGALTALGVDHDRAVLGVPGMNFSTLLRRSVDFNTYAQILYKAYPDELERPLLLSLIQLAWDRGEADGYANHMTTDPLPNTPPKHVLLQVALGDHQVANVTADVEARTIGAATLPNPVAAGRFPDVEPLFGIPRIRSFPYDGSAIVYWDSGTPTPPTQNVPPTGGTDPHETPRNDAKAREQKSAFLQIGGKVIDVCAGAPCTAVDPPGGKPTR